jgi:hypothetical protein
VATGVIGMADKKGAGADQPAKFTTFRLHAVDAEDLNELANRLGCKSIAEVYRKCGFAEVVRQKLLTLNEERLRELKARRPQA